MEAKTSIIKLAKREFKTLSDTEKKFFQAVAEGNAADYTTGIAKKDNPAVAQNWKDDRVLKSDRIEWICTDPEASKMVTRKGVYLIGLRIEGVLDLSHSNIPFQLIFDQCAFFDSIDLNNASIKSLYFLGSHTGPINGYYLKVAGSVYMREGFKAIGEVKLIGATIGGQFDCAKGEFSNKDGKAINADKLKVGSSVFMRDGFRAIGEVNLMSATIGGSLDCWSGEFTNEGGLAINASNLKVGSSVYMRDGFKSIGEVNILSVVVGGQLDCKSGEFTNEGGMAINASNLKVESDVYMREGFKAVGEVNLLGAAIGGHFCWTNINKSSGLNLNLQFANINTLWDDELSWPDKGSLKLQGFVYNELDNRAPMDAGSRLKWLRLQYIDDRNDRNQFFPQPYEQLAKVLRQTGYEEDAKEVLIAKTEDYKKLTKLPWTKKFGFRLLWLIGYGYRPWKASWVMALFILLGTILFNISYSSDLMTATSESAYLKNRDGFVTRDVKTSYPKFNSLVYSIDTFVPLVNFHQQSFWLPDANRGSELFNYGFISLKSGGLLRIYLWFHISFGWLLVSLFAAGLSGLVRK